MPPIRLDQLNLVVRDVDASRAFYARLGLDFGTEANPEWDQHHISSKPDAPSSLVVDLDSARFVTDWDEGWPGGTGVVLGFSVGTRHEVDALVSDLAAHGVHVQQPPWDAFWGARYAVVSDPDGNAVGIMSPVDAARRSPHPPPA